MVAAAAAWAVWLSWHTSPAADALTVTDRVRVLVGVAALALLPWVGRRRGWFGPVGASITARLVRVAGCAGACGLGVAIVRMDRDIDGGPHGATPFSLSREIAAAVLLGAALAALRVVRARWPQVDATALWAIAGMIGAIVLAVVPAQAIAIALRGRDPRRHIAAVAGSERVPRRGRHDRPGRGPGRGPGRLRAEYPGRSLRRPDTPHHVRHDVPVRHPGRRGGVLAAVRHRGSEGICARRGSGRDCSRARSAEPSAGLVLTNFVAIAVFMMVLGPLLGAAGGALGGAVAAEHPRKPRPARSWAAGLFVRS